MKMQIDNVPKEQRKQFKKGILKAINGKGNVYCTLDKAIIETTEPYLATDKSLSLKSKNIKAVNAFLKEYRMYQFNI